MHEVKGLGIQGVLLSKVSECGGLCKVKASLFSPLLVLSLTSCQGLG